jgi:glycosyltransferase involved in cell wall biosynthesis
MTAVAEARGASLYRVPGLGRDLSVLGDVRALWALWRLFRCIRPEIVHTHTAKAGTLGRLAALLAGVPIRLHTFHGHIFRGYFGRWRTVLFLSIEWMLARITTRIVAISARQAEELRRYLGVPADRFVVVELGLDLHRFKVADRNAARERFRAHLGAADRLVVGFVGRLTAIKNHALAVRALATLKDTHPELLFVFVGGGEEEHALKELVRRLGVSDSVQFAGWWDDLEAVYYGSDIIGLTSDNEGTPVCLIEALACGRPVVATDVGGVADVLDNGKLGLLVPPGDVGAFAAAISRMTDPVARERLSTGDTEAVFTRFGVERLIRDIEELYDELIAA